MRVQLELDAAVSAVVVCPAPARRGRLGPSRRRQPRASRCRRGARPRDAGRGLRRSLRRGQDRIPAHVACEVGLARDTSRSRRSQRCCGRQCCHVPARPPRCRRRAGPARSVVLGKRNVVRAAVQPIDDDVRLVVRFAGQAFGRNATDDRTQSPVARLMANSRCSAPNARCMVRMMSLRSPRLPQNVLDVAAQLPAARARPGGARPSDLQMLQAADQKRPFAQAAHLVGHAQVDDASRRR